MDAKNIHIKLPTKFGIDEPPTDTDDSYVYRNGYTLEEAIEDLIEYESDIDPDEDGTFHFWVKKTDTDPWTFIIVSSDVQTRVIVSEYPLE